MFWVLSKAIWAAIQPMVWFAVFNVFAFLAIYRGRQRRAVFWLCLTPAVILTIWATPVVSWIIRPLESRFEQPTQIPSDVRGMILLGGMMELQTVPAGDMPFSDAADRLLTTMRLRSQHPKLDVIVSGASATLRSNYEPEALKLDRYMQTLGFPPVVIDDQSKNSRDHALKIKDLVDDWDRGRWLLVSSAYHQPRLVGLFENEGWSVLAYPTDYRTDIDRPNHLPLSLLARFKVLNSALREWVGLTVYWMRGWTTAWLPGPNLQ